MQHYLGEVNPFLQNRIFDATSQLPFKSPSGAFPNTLLVLILAIPQTWHLATLKFGYSDPLPSLPPTHYNVYVPRNTM